MLLLLLPLLLTRQHRSPPSAYNLFMKAELPKWKAKNPTKDHKEAFTAVAQLWSKNKK